ncbi:MAG: hypothetical protein AAF565_04305 [Pseudomonadota bacterium]
MPGKTTFLSSQRHSPKLNPGDTIWQLIRENWLSNRVFRSYEDIDAHTSEAWSRLTKDPERLRPSASTTGQMGPEKRMGGIRRHSCTTVLLATHGIDGSEKANPARLETTIHLLG